MTPLIRIHSIDIFQPPSIGISPIADMESHHTIARDARSKQMRGGISSVRVARRTVMACFTYAS